MEFGQTCGQTVCIGQSRFAQSRRGVVEVCFGCGNRWSGGGGGEFSGKDMVFPPGVEVGGIAYGLAAKSALDYQQEFLYFVAHGHYVHLRCLGEDPQRGRNVQHGR